MARKNVLILGSTGSIGLNALKVVERFPQRFKIVGLTANNNIKVLSRQIKKYKPIFVAVGGERVGYVQGKFDAKVRVFNVEGDLEELVSLPSVHIIVIGMRGARALKPFLQAVRCGKTIAPANKEALVMAGDIIMKEAKRHGATIIPVDSEQSAIFQCLEGRPHRELKKLYLTASGGALHSVAKSRFDKLSLRQILRHPRWKMGKKITVDSATLMNKGFEVIEASRLFHLNVEDIEVVVHPEAIIHSMVEFTDGSIMAQMGVTDMRLPIQYALTYPDRLESGLKKMDFYALGQLTFQKPDFEKFPSLALAYQVGRRGGTLPSVLNAADEEAVEAFLAGAIRFSQIYEVVEKVVRRHKAIAHPTLEEIFEADRWAREQTRRIMKLNKMAYGFQA